jgi:iron complex outermembrane recepter protein
VPAALALALLLAADAAAGDDAGAAPSGDVVTLPEQTVITGTRSPRPTSSLPTTVEVVGRAAIADSPATTTDALLRAVPSFQTFRRSTSLAADPSSQGLALRGIGPSAVSRTLLLDDGVPVNDPFGGWVAWRALPRLGLDRIEIAPGGASALYGSFALGGVVALVPRPVREGTALEAESAGGSLGTVSGAVRATHRAGPLAAALEADALRTGGYRVVAPWNAGPVDRRSGADHATGTLRLRWAAAPGIAVTAGGTAFAEKQDGGTRYTASAMRMLTARAGVEWTGATGRLEAVLYGGARRFTQDRARISPDRATEVLATRQRVPSFDAGASLVLAPAPRGRHAPALGLDVRRVSGEARDALPDGTAVRSAEGAQVLGGVFAEDTVRLARTLDVAGALRLDGWRNEPARRELTVDGAPRVEWLGARTATELSPRLAVLWRPAPPVALRASGYRAFRAPTLNELYRTFQVGTVITAPDPDLRAERLTGVEAGPEVLLPTAIRVRATAFWNVLADPISVLTLPAPLEDGATRQRANVGRARIRGVEASVAWEPAGPLGVSVAWTVADARVTSAPGHEELVGKRLAQDPLHRVAADLRVAVARTRADLALRWASGQYEDDRNTLPMAAYAVVDVSVAHRLARGVEVFAAAENLLDRRYVVGRAGVDTVGAPRLVRAGLRVRTGAP